MKVLRVIYFAHHCFASLLFTERKKWFCRKVVGRFKVCETETLNFRKTCSGSYRFVTGFIPDRSFNELLLTVNSPKF